MKRSVRNRAKATLKKRTRRGFRGYPIATVAYYGPDDRTVNRISVGIIAEDGGEADMRRFYGEPGQNIRDDIPIHRAVVDHIKARKVVSVALLDQVNGCSCHDDDEMPAAVRCAVPCTFWEDVERPTDRLQRMLGTDDEEE